MTYLEEVADYLMKWGKEDCQGPFTISITPTDRCNLGCLSCWRNTPDLDRANLNKEMTDKQLLRIIDEAAEIGVREIEISGGGEPLVRKGPLLEMVKRIKKAGCLGRMTTNGTLFDEVTIKTMIDCEWDRVAISLDGPEAETNDFLRPPEGTFNKAINALAKFQEYKKLLDKDKPIIELAVVVSKLNLERLPDLIRLAADYGISGVFFNKMIIYSPEMVKLSINSERDYRILTEKAKEADRISKEKRINTNILNFCSLQLNHCQRQNQTEDGLPGRLNSQIESRFGFMFNSPCLEPWYHMFIKSQGEASPCCILSIFDSENIKFKTIKEIWTGRNFSEFRKKLAGRKIDFCNQCDSSFLFHAENIRLVLMDRLNQRNPHLLLAKRVSKEKRFKVLISDTTKLYPPLWGGPKRIWHLYSNLSSDLFDITYVGLDINLKKPYQIEKITENFKSITCQMPVHYYPWYFFEKNLLKNLAFDLFSYLMMWSDSHFKFILNSQKCDVLIASHPWASPCMQKQDGAFFIYDAHNCECLLMEQILRGRWYKDIITSRVRAIEEEACRKSDLILVCSEKEKDDLLNLYDVACNKICLIPNGAESNLSLIEKDRVAAKRKMGIPEDKTTLFFIGSYYNPNIEAARFIIQNLAPQLKEPLFLLAGGVTQAFDHKGLPPNVRTFGKVSEDELSELLSASDIAINPMFSGSGINIKMLDYMAYGLPVVTTECGARGIKTFNRCPMVISSADEFAGNIRMVAKNKSLCKKMAEDGRSLVADYYDWKAISKRLQDIILERLRQSVQ